MYSLQLIERQTRPLTAYNKSLLITTLQYNTYFVWKYSWNLSFSLWIASHQQNVNINCNVCLRKLRLHICSKSLGSLGGRVTTFTAAQSPQWNIQKLCILWSVLSFSFLMITGLQCPLYDVSGNSFNTNRCSQCCKVKFSSTTFHAYYRKNYTEYFVEIFTVDVQ